ncbi:MAG: hypothetical protein JXA66_02220 [Oligoflexia bacterium]|nr:hypothetical protein [Oligoflexia bacterium]
MLKPYFNERCLEMLKKGENESYFEAVDINTGKRVNKLFYNITTGEILVTYSMSHLRGIMDFAGKETEDDWVRANLVYDRKEIWYNTEYAGSLDENSAFNNIMTTIEIFTELGLIQWSVFINTELVYEQTK